MKKPIVFNDVHRHMVQLERIRDYLLDHHEEGAAEIEDAYQVLNLRLVDLYKKRHF